MLYVATSCVYFQNVLTELYFVQCQIHHEAPFPHLEVH